jgi:hypothetical protein
LKKKKLMRKWNRGGREEGGEHEEDQEDEVNDLLIIILARQHAERCWARLCECVTGNGRAKRNEREKGRKEGKYRLATSQPAG